MKRLIPIVLLLFPFLVFSGVKRIPDWAKPYYVKYIMTEPANSDCPVRVFYSKISLKKDGEFIEYNVKRVVNVLNLKGVIAYSSIVIPFYKGDTVVKAKICRVDSGGTVKEVFNKKDMNLTAVSQNFVDDSKQLSMSFDSLQRGDVVIVDYTIRKKEIFEDFFLSFAEDGEILESEIEADNPYRVAVLNDPKGLVVRENNTFKVSHLPYLKDEDFMPPRRDIYPLVAISYSKDLDSWEKIGKIYWDMVKPSMDVSPSSEGLNLSDLKDKKAVIEKVLKYAAEKISYVDIEIGSGRIVPKKCSFVLERKYGDCKDKSVFAVNLLRNVGIQAFPVLAKGVDDGRVYPEFPGIQFNHVIVAVRLDKETADLSNVEIDGTPYVFFDVTDRITDIPFFPSSLQGTYALIISEKGGKLVKLPVFSPEQNVVDFSSKCNLSEDGSASIELIETKKGLAAFSEKWFISGLTKDDETKSYTDFVQNKIDGAVLVDYEVENEKDKVKTDYTLKVPSYAIKTTEGLLVIPFPLTYNYKNPFRKRKRKTDIVYKTKITVVRKSEWQFDNGFSIKKLPSNAEIDCPYFYFSKKVEALDNKVVITATYIRKKIHIPQSEYKVYRKFYKKYLKQLKQPLVLVKK